MAAAAVSEDSGAPIVAFTATDLEEATTQRTNSQSNKTLASPREALEVASVDLAGQEGGAHEAAEVKAEATTPSGSKKKQAATVATASNSDMSDPEIESDPDFSPTQNLNSYDISGLRYSNSETEDEGRSKPVPAWARSPLLFARVRQQCMARTNLTFRFKAASQAMVNLAEIFPDQFGSE